MYSPQLPGGLFSPSDIWKKLSHHILLHFPFGMGASAYNHYANYLKKNCIEPNFKQENKSKLIHYQQSDVPLNDLCEQDILLNQLVWPEKFARVSFKDMCDKLNGYMPSITDQGNLLRSIENKTLRRYSGNVDRDLGVDQNVPYIPTVYVP